MDKINFLAGEDFPVSTNTFDRLQQATNMVANLAKMGGLNYILSGCETEGSNVAPGIIVIAGEILPFLGGVKKTKITIQETKIQLEAFDVHYSEAYINRIAVFANDGAYNWADFKPVRTNKQLEDDINAITGDVPGITKGWAGFEAKIPKDYMFCDGRALLIADYPELYENIGVLHGGDGTTYFNLPKSGGRVAVGYDASKEAYDRIGKSGGSETVTLTVDQLANHKHIMPWGENPSTAWNPTWGYAPAPYNQDMRGSNANDSDNSWAYSSDVGKGEPHNNMQPYYVEGKIIKVK